uniref:Putative salivary secreted lipocalin n=1 Tax=Ornithodoros turicata TaxID=34597 RepID=A0A2R5L4S0_9ACAR
MLQVVVFLTGCCFVASVHAACNKGPFDAKKSIIGPGTGKYYLVKSTYLQNISCLYVVPPPEWTTFPTEYSFGYKEGKKWVQKKETVNGEGPNIIDSDAGFGVTNTTLVYSDYKECDVGLFHGGKVGGPYVELWKHSDAKKGSEGLKCCQKYFRKELEKQGKSKDDFKKVDKHCKNPA